MSQLDPTTTAVLVVDVQVGVLETNPPPLGKAQVLERINHVTAAARAVAAPVIFLQHDGDPGTQWLTPSTNEWKLDPSLHIEDCDCVMRKTACDGFYRTALEGYLKGKAIDTLIMMGYATDFCVDTTVRSAASREFTVIVVAGAHTTKDRPVLAAAQIIAHHEWLWTHLICPKGVSLLSVAEVVERLARGA
jgi:nicotinamidase-related amidase